MTKPISNLDSALAELARRAPCLDVELSGGQLELIRTFLIELAGYNAHTNLVSCADPGLVVAEHVLDSLSLVAPLRSVGADRGRLVDVGSGGGFPAFVLAIALPDMELTLIESVAKKARFLAMLNQTLAFSARLRVLNDRAENVARDRTVRASFDAATARAVGKIDLASELCLPLLKKGGWLLAQKSNWQIEEEQRRAKIALPILGGEIRRLVQANRQALEKEHVILMIEKTGDSADRFPRTAAQMKRAPLGGQV